MIYLKSFLAGVLAIMALLVGVVALAILAPILYNATHPLPDGTHLGWDQTTFGLFVVWPPVWPIVLLVAAFLVGFFWEYRRLAKREHSHA